MDKLHRHFGLSDPIGEVANILENLYIKPRNKISTYNVDFICYASQLDWRNSVLCYCYYQRLPNRIQDPISIQEQEKPTLFQDMYVLAMTINHCYWEWDCECHHTKQAEKEALKSYSRKQGKAFTSSTAIAPQNKANLSPVTSSAKNSSSKSPSSSAPKKQPNTLRIDLSSKLASNSKLTSDKCKKCLKNNLCLYCSAGDHKLDFCSKKQTMVSPKGRSASTTANTPAAVSKKPSEK